ncbi:MAG: mechanosensitive ion channel family protein [DPANN group archaeon]|nr:mechanosensitive ion channel family protein [DPANN group archaeon]
MVFIVQDMLTDIYYFNPVFFNFIGIIFLGHLGGILIKYIILRLSKMTGIDDMMKSSKVHIILKEIGYRGSAINLVADITRLFVYMLALSSAFEIIGLKEISAIFSTTVKYLPNIVVAVIIIIIGSFVADLFSKIISELIHGKNKRSELNGLVTLVSAFTSIMLYIIAIIIALRVLGVDPTAITVLMGVLLLTASALFIISLKDLAPNFIAGIQMKNIGLNEKDKVVISGISGEIINIGTFVTEIRSTHKNFIIPNNNFIKNSFEKV